MSMNFELARQNMVANQVRPWEVFDPQVLGVLSKVKREDFVPAAYRQLAFADLSLPLGEDQVMMKPILEGRLLQALALRPGESVLEVGTGSGFLTACLATLAAGGQVTSLDIRPAFIEQARQHLQAAGLGQVQLESVDALHDYQAPEAGFDALVLTGACHHLPERMLGWLKPGGRLFAICGDSPVQRALLLHKESASHCREEPLFETDLPYLSHAEPPQQFVF